MAIELTNDEKMMVVTQHIKNINYSLYNLNLSLNEARAIAVPNQDTINGLILQINDANAQLAVLQQEQSSLQPDPTQTSTTN
jgi:hypothetical protein